jgi:hypothetical protein
MFDNMLLFGFHSDNLYGLWFVFMTECEFDNIDLEGNYTEWRHVSDVRTYRSMILSLNRLNSYFRIISLLAFEKLFVVTWH